MDTMRPNRHSQTNEADSDQEPMAVDDDLTPKTKRVRISPS